ncbi:MAG: hypothetical protein J0H64_08185, partial [Actinobacteria bacterium]|nr:hypothetical protein [Actinomycetota bacterium]
QVKALATLPDGRIAVGGFFTQVNGQPRSSRAVLNTDGTLASGWGNSGVVNHLSGGATNIRSLDVQDGWLYAGGLFTHATGGTGTQETYARDAVRFKISTGAPDGTWNPEFNATVMSLDASKQGDRVYFAGFFTASQSRPAEKGAALATGSTALLPWTPTFSSSANYQQAVLEVGNRVWLGGSEHSLFSYSRDNFALQSTTVGNNGGDFQALASDGNAVYGSCHCFETMYDGSRTWPNTGSNWTATNAIYGSGAWSAADGKRLPEFNGTFNTSGGAGAWALFVDSKGTLWQGGDYSYSTRAGFVRQWSGGFVRHAQRDASPPTTPTDVTGNVKADGTVALAWQPSTDNIGVTGYEVLRKDCVVATVTDPNVTLPPAPAGIKYYVRAVDAQGNASASTAALDPGTLTPANDVQTVVPAGSTWSYLYNADGPSGAWTGVNYDASSWASGAA